MRGSAAFRTGVAPGGALAPGWVRDALWRSAQTVPSLDLRFADNKSLTDAVSNSNLVTFTRASSGTYVGSDGVLKTATTNLLLRSEEFQTTWTTTRASISSDTVAAPNGTLTADKLVEDSTASSTHFVGQTTSVTSGLTYTASIYAKAAERTEVVVQLTTGFPSTTIRVNLSTGATANTGGSPVATSVQALFDGWYRISLTQTANLTTSVSQTNIILSVGGTTVYTGNGSSGIYLWGAQLEQSSTVGEYIPTTSTINSAPRFDHNPTTGESLGLLVEEQRTNSIRNNTMVGAVAGTPGTLPTNYGISGLGTLSQQVVEVGSSGGVNYIDLRLSGTTSTTQASIRLETPNGAAGTNGQTFSFSCWFARIAGSLTNITGVLCNANIYDATTAFLGSANFAGFDSTNQPTSFIRRSGTLTIAQATAAFIQPQIVVLFNSGVAIDITLRIGLPQLEQGAFATSVIPTSTAAATRSADVASITGTNFSSWYSQSEGTVFADAAGVNNIGGATRRYCEIRDNATTDRLILGYSATNNNRFLVIDDGVTIADITATGAPIAKAVGTYRVNSFQLASNGALGTEDSAGTVPTPNQMFIGSQEGGTASTFLNGTIRRLCYWDQRLPNSTLQQITA